MARMRYSDEDIVNLLRQIESDLNGEDDVGSACGKAGISDATYDTWRKRYGGMATSQLQALRTLEKENARLQRTVADLELDKLILTESPDYLKPEA